MTMQSLKDRLAALKEQVEYDQKTIERLTHDRQIATDALETLLEPNALRHGHACQSLKIGELLQCNCGVAMRIEKGRHALDLMRGEATP